MSMGASITAMPISSQRIGALTAAFWPMLSLFQAKNTTFTTTTASKTAGIMPNGGILPILGKNLEE